MQLVLLDDSGEEISRLSDLSKLFEEHPLAVIGHRLADWMQRYSVIKPTTGTQYNAVVELHGGTVQGVITDACFPLRVVILEYKKYAETDNEVFVDDSDLFVYADHDSDMVTTEELQSVLAAADKRISIAEKEDEDAST